MPEEFIPRPYQSEAIRWLLERKNAALFASPGTGKTVVTFTALSELIVSGRSAGALVVGPIRVGALTYPNQLRRWAHLNWLRYFNLREPEARSAWERGTGGVYFINFEMLATRQGARKKGFVERYIKNPASPLPVDTLIIDESSKLKDPSGKASRCLLPFLHDIPGRYVSPFKRRWALTGTPASESYLDLFNQVRLLDGGERLGRSFHQFRQAHAESDYMGWKWTMRPGAKERIDAKISDLALVIRGEDHLDLPPLIVEDIEVPLPGPVMAGYKKLEKDFLLKLKTGEIEALSAATLVNKLAQYTSGSVLDSGGEAHPVHDCKIKALRKLLKSCEGDPLLVMVHYVSTRDRLLKEFPESKAFDEKRLGDWQAGKIPLLIANAQSMAHGIDGLQTGRRICWFDQTYSMELCIQANARVYRMGQTRPTIVSRLLASDTIDWAIVEALREKDAQQKGLLAAVRNLQQLRGMRS